MKDCKFCDKQGVWIYPLRHAVAVAATPGDLNALPASLPPGLSPNVADITLTANARYVPRILRGGYVYALIERSKVRYWQAYMVVEESLLYQFDPESPPANPVAFSCERTSCGVDASVISVDNVDTVTAVWLMFSPSALTKPKLDEYKSNADRYESEGKMQLFDVKMWAATGTLQTHAMSAENLRGMVAEYVLYGQGKDALSSPLGLAMQKQMFPAISAAYAGTPTNSNGSENGYLGVLAQRLAKQKALVCVLYDHIGITQELNDFRNAPLEGLENYMAAVDPYGASNQHRLQVHESIRELEAGMKQGIVQREEEWQAAHRRVSDGFRERMQGEIGRMRHEGREDLAKRAEQDLEQSRINRERNYEAGMAESRAKAEERWNTKYANRLDNQEMQDFENALKRNTQTALDTAAARAVDHLKWFESQRLVNAFDMFDSKANKAGYDFAVHSAICSIGLSGCKVGEDKIDAWLKAPEVERKNLYARGIYYNQDTLIAEAKEANRQIKEAVGHVDHASGLSTAVMLKAVKGLVDGFKKVDSAFDEWARNQGQPFSQRWAKGLEVVLYHKASDLTRAVFRSGLGGSFDKGLTASLSGVLYARLRATVGSLAYEDLMLALPVEKIRENARARVARRAEQRRSDTARTSAAKVAGQVDGSLETLVADAQEKAQAKVKLSLDEIKGNKNLPTNNYHQTRIGVLLGCIEMIALGEKLTHFEPGTKGWIEVGGSAMSVGSIVLDTYYSAAKSIREIRPYSSVKAINAGADIVRGGFKLGAGVLGAGAGLCGAYLDLMKFKQEKNVVLATIYSVRAATGLISAGLTIVAAFSYTAPLLGHLAKGYATHSIRYRLLTSAAGLAVRLAARVRLLVWVARLNLIGLALTALEIGYLLLKDDDLQNWCEKCVFRKEKKTRNFLGREVTEDYFKTGAVEELTELDKAAQAVGLGT